MMMIVMCQPLGDAALWKSDANDTKNLAQGDNADVEGGVVNEDMLV
jgi:hypothetical protein